MDWTRFALLACACAAEVAAQAGAGRVTHGPMLGRPGPTHMGVWARTERPGSFRVRYGLAPGRMDALSGPARTSLEHDNTGWILIEGLRPDTKYYYQVVPAGSENAPARPHGSFLTLPDPAAYRNAGHNPKGLFNFRFEFACGNNQGAGSSLGPALPAFRTMLERLKDKVHFAILNGDWLYEAERAYPADRWMKDVGIAPTEAPPILQLAPSIAGVWHNYKLYLSRGENLSAWHRNIPSLFTIDDHEILNDVYGTGSPGRRDRATVFRDIGTQAWRDYLAWSNPVEHPGEIRFGRARLEAGSDVLTDPEADFDSLDPAGAPTLHVHWGGQLAGVTPREYDGSPGDPNAGVYEIAGRLDRHRLRISPPARAAGSAAYSIGSPTYYQLRVGNAHFLFLDTRTYRQMHDVNRRSQPGLSMLGPRQKAWLQERMKNSDADFFFVVSSVNLMVPHVGLTPNAGERAQRVSNKDDAWTVFLDEREELIRFWDGLGKPVLVLTGDLHNSFAIRITDRVWEFAGAPHNSRNHTAHSESDRPPNGPFDSFGRKCDIRWSSYFLDDVPGELVHQPIYTVIQVNNVFNNPLRKGAGRWVAYPCPQVVVQYYDGFTGDLLYAEALAAAPRP